MGHIESKSYLVSPATAAVTAIRGRLTDPRTMVSETEGRKMAADAKKPFMLPPLP